MVPVPDCDVDLFPGLSNESVERFWEDCWVENGKNDTDDTTVEVEVPSVQVF